MKTLKMKVTITEITRLKYLCGILCTIFKITRHTEPGKGVPPLQERPQNHDTKQCKNSKMRLKYREKIKLRSQWAQVHSALGRAQGVTTIHNRRQQIPQTLSAGRNDRLNWSVFQRGIVKAYSPRAAKP